MSNTVGRVNDHLRLARKKKKKIQQGGTFDLNPNVPKVSREKAAGLISSPEVGL